MPGITADRKRLGAPGPAAVNAFGGLVQNLAEYPWLERNIGPFSSIFRAWQKHWQQGLVAGVLPIFTEVQNTEELLEVICPSP
jgi:hypothetical protein